MNVLVWLTRDLRVHDHPALVAAAAAGRVLPVFVADPAYWAAPTAAARQWEFLAGVLAHARGQFAAAGAPLAVRLGPAAEVLARLVARHRIGRVVSSFEPGAELRLAAGVDWQVVPPGRADVPALLPVEGVEPGVIPPAGALRLAVDRCPNRQAGGDPAALLARGRRPGAKTGSGIDGMERAASRLSPFLAWGAVSETEAAACAGRAALARRAAAQSGQHEPPPPGAALTPAWARGETGLPFADASLRYLAATGWLPAPLRAMLLSVGVHLLGAGAREAGWALARGSTDYDPALLWAGVAAALAHPVDPVALGERLDPGGVFLRRWLPELAHLRDAALHRPWRWQGARHLLGHRYPEPLADPGQALKACRAARSDGPRAGLGGRRALPVAAVGDAGIGGRIGDAGIAGGIELIEDSGASHVPDHTARQLASHGRRRGSSPAQLVLAF